MTSSTAEQWQRLLDEGFALLRQGDHRGALRCCDQAASASEEARYHAGLLRGDILMDLGDAAGALNSYESVAHPELEDPDVDCARGIALFELGKLPEAQSALRSAVRGKPDLAEAHYTLGLIAELYGSAEADELLRRARRSAPERFAPTPRMARQRFERLVDEALHDLPPAVRRILETVPVVVAELPHLDDLAMFDPPISPLVLGMFVGQPSGTAQPSNATAQPPTIVLFKRNLERAFSTPEQLRQELRQTVLREIASAFNLPATELGDDPSDAANSPQGH